MSELPELRIADWRETKGIQGTGDCQVLLDSTEIDRVISSFTPACGNCFFCLRDQSQLCETMGAHMFVPKATRADGSAVIGASGLGTFADEMTVDESMLVKVETDLPSEQLALIGCGGAPEQSGQP